MPATMQDVARKAGVSKTTVSRVINGVPNSASSQTVDRILEAVEELGYAPNIIAASLKRLSTRTIGLIVGDIENPFFGSIIRGVEATLQRSDYTLILANSSYKSELEEALAHTLLQRQVDAMILAPSTLAAGTWLRHANERNVHVLLVDNYIEGAQVDQVVVDNFDASFRATKYLIELGHRRLAMIAGPHGRSTGSQRTDGFMAAFTDQSIVIEPQLVFEGDFSIESGYLGMQALLALRPLPTAVFIANNFMAVGAMKAIHEAGLAIPDQLSIISFDDMYWFPITSPSLTAISQPAFEMGQRAAERLLLRLNRTRQPRPERIELKTTLIVRES